MNATPIILAILVLLPIPAASQPSKAITANEDRQVEFAERIVMIELVQELSLSVRREREKCSLGCYQAGAMELAIGSIGLARGQVGSLALVNLLGLKLDGAASSELHCQILLRRSQLMKRLKHFPAHRAVSYCHARYQEAKKRPLMEIHDVSVTEVCRTEAQVDEMKGLLLSALRSQSVCE